MKVMRIAFVVVMSLALCGPVSLIAFGDEGPLDTAQPKGVTSEEIIQRFAAKEKEFKQALEMYGYRQTVKVMATPSMANISRSSTSRSMIRGRKSRTWCSRRNRRCRRS